MQYMLMCCFDEKRWQELPEETRAKIMRNYGEWTQATSKSGHLRATGKLQATSVATTLRERNGKRVLTDGPFAETKEQMGGYHLIECKDLDEAISIASRIPTLASGGAVEVRPLDPAYKS